MNVMTAKTDTERALRVELAACYRVFDLLGWTELIYNHITVRVPGPERHFLINPYGLTYREVTASNLVKIDIEGRPVGPSRHPVNPAGLPIHTAIHAARADAHCVMHMHTTAGVAIACLAEGLSRDNFYGAQLDGAVAYHDFEGITTDPDEKPRLVASLGDKHVLILRSHGLLTCGETIPAAFIRMWALQRACEVQLAALSTGRAVMPVKPAVAAKASAQVRAFDKDAALGAIPFAALVRRVEALDPSYKE
jgi:ribulose-5-phosphate 4-epimerase/fuculose-1-phosphate aldolase